MDARRRQYEWRSWGPAAGWAVSTRPRMSSCRTSSPRIADAPRSPGWWIATRRSSRRSRPIIPPAACSTEWRVVLDDPSIDLIDICLPDSLHYETAKAALKAGKHVYCEKPLTETASQARELAELARRNGLITRVGHNFPFNPVHSVAKEIIARGDVGDIRFVRAAQHVNSLADPNAPFVWRCDRTLSASGIVGDTGSHVFSLLDYLVGPIAELIADTAIQTRHRPLANDFNRRRAPR